MSSSQKKDSDINKEYVSVKDEDELPNKQGENPCFKDKVNDGASTSHDVKIALEKQKWKLQVAGLRNITTNDLAVDEDNEIVFMQTIKMQSKLQKYRKSSEYKKMVNRLAVLMAKEMGVSRKKRTGTNENVSAAAPRRKSRQMCKPRFVVKYRKSKYDHHYTSPIPFCKSLISKLGMKCYNAGYMYSMKMEENSMLAETDDETDLE